jgi:F0F1-type ATP synthase assembly protein I
MNSPINQILPGYKNRASPNAARKLFVVQALTALGAATFFGLWLGSSSALAALWGTTAAAANVLLLAWRWQQGAQAPHLDAQRHLRSFYGSSLERLFIVGALFAIGLGSLHLSAVPMMAGFVLGQLGIFTFPFLPAAKFIKNV